MEFKTAALDRAAKIISAVVSILLLIMAVFFFIKVPYGWIFTLLMMLIIIVSYLLSPSRYFIKGGQLIIENVIGKQILVQLDAVEGYARIPDIAKLHAARVFGNGGFFGYYGLYSTAEYGMMNCQLTSLKNVFVIKTAQGTFALSPREPERFEEQLKTVTTGMLGEIKTLTPTTLSKAVLARPGILVIPTMLFVITVIMVLITYAQLPERIAIHFDLQGNPNGWGTRTSYLISGIAPSLVVFVVAIFAFFIVRKTTLNRALTYFIVLIISFIQLFTLYVACEVYWFNLSGSHVIPIGLGMLCFFIILALFLIVYYRSIVKQTARK